MNDGSTARMVLGVYVLVRRMVVVVRSIVFKSVSSCGLREDDFSWYSSAHSGTSLHAVMLLELVSGQVWFVNDR